MKIIIWHGIRRNGNHGLIQLFLNSLNYRYIFCNNTILNYEEYNSYNDENSRFKGYKNVKLLLLSIENKKINLDEIYKFNNFGNSNNIIKKVIIIRNPYNMLASNYKYFNKNTIYLEEIIKLWIDYCKFILSENDFITIFYDKFYNDDNYKEEIEKQLDIKFNYNFINKRENYSISSFMDTNTNEFNRYLHYIDDVEFNKIVLQNEELKYYYNLLCVYYNYKQ